MTKVIRYDIVAAGNIGAAGAMIRPFANIGAAGAMIRPLANIGAAGVMIRPLANIGAAGFSPHITPQTTPHLARP